MRARAGMRWKADFTAFLILSLYRLFAPTGCCVTTTSFLTSSLPPYLRCLYTTVYSTTAATTTTTVAVDAGRNK